MIELKLDQLSVRQKLGMCMCARADAVENEEENNNFILDMIRDHALGAVWVRPSYERADAIIARIRETADYPVLIMTDAENGFADFRIGNHNAIGCTGSEELAYIFGKVVGVTARQRGYNAIGNPVLDMVTQNTVCGGSIRPLGGDKHKVAKLGAAIARGMHDGGILTIGKHYPGSIDGNRIDTHMAEAVCMKTKEELLEYNLFPYLKLMEEGLLDGIMTSHKRLPNIDPDYPASLSQRVIHIIREQGFDGFAITDALIMGGVTAKFGVQGCKGLSIAAGNDLALTWGPNRESYQAICDAYDAGVISDQRLDEAVSRVLQAQHKSLLPPVFTELTPQEIDSFQSINRKSIIARCDDGVPAALPRDKRHYFVVLAENEIELSDAGKVQVDTQLNSWYRPGQIMDRLQTEYPDSSVTAIYQFPSAAQVCRVLEDSLEYDDVIFVTFFKSQAYVGWECFTSRILAAMEALQVTNRISTVVHFGNPFMMEELPHVPRILLGGPSVQSVEYGLDVLEGKYPAEGKLTYDIRLRGVYDIR